MQARWIDINKGDKARPNLRSRYVAKEFNDGEQEGLFASTPPLEALRILVSDAATIRKGRMRKVIMINDVARAFFEAPSSRKICAELPPEELGAEDGVGCLEMSLYGTRDAAANFQAEIKTLMVGAGFAQGKHNASTYYNKGRNLRVLVHGDDFVTSGERPDIRWFQGVLEERFEISTKVIGDGPGELSSAKVLNRVISVSESGWTHEADQRHADLIVKAMGLEQAKGGKTPGEEARPWAEEEDAKLLDGREQGEFRSIAARANYLALDRADIEYATKEVCRAMATPTRGDLRKLRRLARYLIDRPRVVSRFDYQGDMPEVSGYTDSDWAGCRRTAKSTSGGAVMIGNHCIKTWSSTQKNITLSSAEAELVATVRMSTELIGITQLLHEWGMEKVGSVYIDSSAALAVVKRKGAGKMRHVRVGELWIQEKSENGEIEYVKTAGSNNPADLMTKYLAESVIIRHVDFLHQEFQKGRADLTLTV